MRSCLLALAATVVALVCAPAAGAQSPTPNLTPAPHLVVTTIDRTPVVQLSDGAGGLPYLGTTSSINAGELSAALTSFHDSGVYEHELEQVDGAATRWLKLRVRGGKAAAAKTRAARAAGRRSFGPLRFKPAIVLDIDETTLSNWTAIKGDAFVYGPQTKAEAVNQIGTAIAPTHELYDLARSLGVTVFFITGRGEAVREPTEANLRREGFTTWERLYLKPAGFAGTTIDYKSGARAEIEQAGYRIVENVGDQFSDLAGGHAEAAYKLPNPFYYLP